MVGSSWAAIVVVLGVQHVNLRLGSREVIMGTYLDYTSPRHLLQYIALTFLPHSPSAESEVVLSHENARLVG
jgi:hypothetical protein